MIRRLSLLSQPLMAAMLLIPIVVALHQQMSDPLPAPIVTEAIGASAGRLA